MKVLIAIFSLIVAGVYSISIEECMNDPSNSECRTVSYPYDLAVSDLQNVCRAMPWMPGCSLWNTCKQHSSDSGFCQPLSLLNDICIKDRMQGMSGCRPYVKLCRQGSVMEICSIEAIPNVLTTVEVKRLSQSLCEKSPSPKCGSCDLTKPRGCDYLSIYSDVCIHNHQLSECSRMNEMCSALTADTFDVLCGRSSSAVQMEESGQYSNEDIEKDLDSLCSDMECMPGCSIRHQCKFANRADGTCSPLKLLSDICEGDSMSGMEGCTNYPFLCANATETEDCLPNRSIPTTSDVEEAIKQICSSHFMEDCPPNNDVSCTFDHLETYSKLCKAMPYMRQCASWKTFCNDSEFSSSSYCTSGEMDPPIMRMYFHFGLADYILFKEWVPRNEVQYWLSFIAIVVLAIVYELVVTVRIVFDEDSILNQKNTCQTIESPDEERKLFIAPGFKNYFSHSKYKFVWQVEFARGILQFIETILSYSLMLIAMTFNVGLFLAIPFGFTVGVVLFARFRNSPKRPSCC